MKGGVNVGQHTFHIHVIPNSEAFKIVGWDHWRKALKIKVKNRAEGGKANKELINELTKLLNHEVMIKSGHTGRNKTIVVFCEDDELPEIYKKLKINEAE